MNRGELKQKIREFIEGLEEKDLEEIRLTFTEVVGQMKDEKYARSVKENPVSVVDVPSAPAHMGEPALDGNIKNMLFSQLKQVAGQLANAGREAISQMGGIKKDIKDKVRITDRQEKS